LWFRSDLSRLRFSPDGTLLKSLAHTDDAPASHSHPFTDITGTETDTQHGVRTLASAHKFTDLDFTSSNLTSIVTRRHTDLSNLALDEHTQYVLRSIMTTRG